MIYDSIKKQTIPTDDELAYEFCKKHPNIRYGLNNFQEYQTETGHYVLIDVKMIRKLVLQLLIQNKNKKIRPNKNRISSVVSLLESILFIEDAKWLYHNGFLNLENGVLEIATRKLLPHSPSFFFLEVLPYNYDPQAKMPDFWFLKTILKDERILVQEFLGNCLTEQTDHELSLFLLGPPASGRSTLLKCVQFVLGNRAIVLSLRDLMGSQFNRELIVGKTLVYSTETPNYNINIIDLLSAMISGEPILVEKKYEHPYSYRPYAKYIFAMNELPLINAHNHGLKRRILIIETHTEIPEDERNPQKRNLTKKELAGTLNWMLEGLQRLETRGNFEIPDVTKIRTEEYFSTFSLPKIVLEFIELKCEKSQDYEIQSQILFDNFQNWLRFEQLPNISIKKFNQIMNYLGFDQLKRSKQFWQGIKLK